MWLLQIGIASFWWLIAVHLLFREALAWRAVEDIGWFRRRFKNGASREWERFCRDAGLLCAIAAGLLLLQLPFGLGALGVIMASLPLLLLR